MKKRPPQTLITTENNDLMIAEKAPSTDQADNSQRAERFSEVERKFRKACKDYKSAYGKKGLAHGDITRLCRQAKEAGHGKEEIRQWLKDEGIYKLGSFAKRLCELFPKVAEDSVNEDEEQPEDSAQQFDFKKAVVLEIRRFKKNYGEVAVLVAIELANGLGAEPAQNHHKDPQMKEAA